jgi:gas vesicle protein
MTHNSNMGTGLFCFALGAAVGAGVTALYTPQSGKRMRRQMLRKAEDAQERALDKGHEIAERGRELYERGAKFAEHAISR